MWKHPRAEFGLPEAPLRAPVAADLLESIRGENLGIYRTSAQRLREDVGQEDEIARDYRGRLVYELIQNADDAIDIGGAAQLRIELHPDGLWFANSGRELAEGDVRGICGISASTKRVDGSRKRASIGHKGMGFKSVLEISRAPEVYSTSCSFRFDEPLSLAFLREAGFETRHAPLMRIPWTIAKPREAWGRLRDQGMVTAFFLPFAERARESTFAAVDRALNELPETTSTACGSPRVMVMGPSFSWRTTETSRSATIAAGWWASRGKTSTSPR